MGWCLLQEYFLGSGGVLGLLSSLVGQPLPGKHPAAVHAVHAVHALLRNS